DAAPDRAADAPDPRDGPVPAPTRHHRAPPPPVHAEPIDGDTVSIMAPADEAFALLLEAAHVIGDVTYVSPRDGLFEALVKFDDGRTCSLVISLQGRGNGTTEAFCTLQALDGGPVPSVSIVVDELVAAITAPPPPPS